jgi:hypothetical protein
MNEQAEKGGKGECENKPRIKEMISKRVNC